jgi:energy-coupling factor transporter ATP-binding protein EcfA2
VLDLDRRRFLFVTGKGGVGKSTVCAALATALAAAGKRVLVATTGAKERISELVGSAPLEPQIRALRPNLWGVALRAEVALREYGQLKLKSRLLVDALFDNRYVQGFFAGASNNTTSKRGTPFTTSVEWYQALPSSAHSLRPGAPAKKPCT